MCVVSLVCIVFILFLLTIEIYFFVTPELTTLMFVDESGHEERVPVFLNITFPSLECSILGLDLQDDLGRHEVGSVQTDMKKTEIITGNVRGCRFEASFFVNKVPGNFHLGTHAALANKNTVPTQPIIMAHTVHELRFGDVVTDSIPGTYSPVNGKKSLIYDTAHSHDYFLKIVPTVYQPLGKPPQFPFQFTYSYKSYQHNHPPAAVWFRYDLSPITIQYAVRKQHLYAFLGRTVAYVGGTFTVAGIIDSIIFTTGTVFKKLEIGKFS
jgi:hypothetical protein